MDFLVPGRSAELPAHSAGELDATLVLAVPLDETSVKCRQGPPRALPHRDGAAPWTGVVPIELDAPGADPGVASRGGGAARAAAGGAVADRRLGG